MARAPDPTFSENEKRLLSLLARLLLDRLQSDAELSNLPRTKLALTDDEARELLVRLDQLTRHTRFYEAATLAEGLSQPAFLADRELKDIYLSTRVTRGRTRTMPTKQWEDFLTRLGLLGTSRHSRYEISQMTEGQFLTLERRLLYAVQLPDEVVQHVMVVAEANWNAVEKIRKHRLRIPHGAIREAVLRPFGRLRDSLVMRAWDRTIGTTRLAAAIGILADISVLGVTRDWSVIAIASQWANWSATATLED